MAASARRTAAPRRWRNLVAVSTRSLAVAALVAVAVLGARPSIVPARMPPGSEPPFRVGRELPLPRARLAAATSDSKCWVHRASEKAFARRMNVARGAAGRSRLSSDPELSRVARKHTNEMIAREVLHHTSTTALSRRVTGWTILGENVGVGASVESLDAAFMASIAHRDNILYPSFRHVGVGARTSDGRLWVTVVFETRADPGTSLRMPRC